MFEVVKHLNKVGVWKQNRICILDKVLISLTYKGLLDFSKKKTNNSIEV